MATKKSAKRTTKSVGTRETPRMRAVETQGTSALAQGTEEDLRQLLDAARRTFERLRDLGDDVPDDRREEYLRDRHFAREAFERAEIAAFQDLVEQQKAQLPAVKASMAKLAKSAETAASVIGVLNVVSAALGVLASVVTLFA